VFLVNSRLSHFTATLEGSTREELHLLRAPLIPKLRGQIAEFLNEGSLVRLRILISSTCVGLRYGHLKHSLEAFLGSIGSTDSFTRRIHYHSPLRVNGTRIFLGCPPTGLASTPILRPVYQSASPHRTNVFPVVQEFSCLFPIAYAFRPRLRDRLTLGGLTFPRKPWIFGEQGSHLFCRYSCRHDHFHEPTALLSVCLVSLIERSPTDLKTIEIVSNPVASVSNLSPVTFSAQNHLTSELLRTLSMVAASKPTSWLSEQSHILSHLARILGP